MPGVKYFLYTIIDIYSRKVVAWTIHPNESETHARRLITQACRRPSVDRDQRVIHADRGSPMIAGTVAGVARVPSTLPVMELLATARFTHCRND